MIPSKLVQLEKRNKLLVLEDMMPKAEHNKGVKDKTLKNIPFFGDLSPDEAQLIQQLIVQKRFQKDKVILTEEDTPQYMYFIFSGKVRVVKLSEDGREQIITFHKKGDYFGEMSLLDGKTSPATIIAHEDTVIGLLHKNDFEYHFLKLGRIRRTIMDLLCQRLREAWHMIKILSFESAEHRVIAALDHLKNKYGVKDDRGIIINIKLTHQMIASYASVARETSTRILNKLVRAGAIQILENKSFLLEKSFDEKVKEIMR